MARWYIVSHKSNSPNLHTSIEAHDIISAIQESMRQHPMYTVVEARLATVLDKEDERNAKN